MSECNRFFFASDMNLDGVVTISDFGLILKLVFYFPANLIVWLVEQKPSAATFFEIDCSIGTGWGAAIFSLFVWMLVFLVASE